MSTIKLILSLFLDRSDDEAAGILLGPETGSLDDVWAKSQQFPQSDGYGSRQRD